MKKSIASLLAAIALSGCASDGDSASDRSQLIGRYFVLHAVDGRPVAPREGLRPGIRFAPGMQVSGVMCNRFFGQGELQQGQLHVAQLASTRMLCRDGELNQWEQALTQLLSAGATVALSDGTLTLSGAGHTLVYQAG